MSLDAILDDLQSDLPNSEEVKALEEITLSSSTNNSTPESQFKLDSSVLNKGVLNKFNTLYQQLTLKKTINSLVKVDLRIAQEVFTMLPELDSNTQAKVTSYPSVMNKQVLASVLDSVTDELPIETKHMLKDFLATVKDNQNNIERVGDILQTYNEICNEETIRLNKVSPVIIANKNSYNLFTCKMKELLWINDSELEYKKYEDTLIKQYNDLVYDDGLKTFLSFYDTSEKTEEETTENKPKFDLSLMDLCTRVSNTYQIVSSSLERLNSYIGRVEVIILADEVKVNDEVNEVVNLLPEYTGNLSHLKMLFDIVTNENNFIEKLVKLLKFID